MATMAPMDFVGLAIAASAVVSFLHVNWGVLTPRSRHAVSLLGLLPHVAAVHCVTANLAVHMFCVYLVAASDGCTLHMDRARSKDVAMSLLMGPPAPAAWRR